MNSQTNDFNGQTPREKLLAQGRFFCCRRGPQSSHPQGLGRHTTGNRQSSGFTLVETLMSILIIAMFFATILLGYTRGAQRAQWSGYSLAAQSQTMKQLEEFRAVLWDTQAVPIVDDTTNVPAVMVLPLDLPISGTNIIYATNTATVTTITNLGNGAAVKMIVINTTWPYNGRTFTNTVVDYRAPDQ
jgi:type II secretory pathway pseudopilin PulG